MIELPPAPDAVVDPATGIARVGSFQGSFARVDLSRLSNPIALRLIRKRWMYVAMTRGPIFVAAAVIDLGYSGAAFAFVYDASARRLLVDASAVGLFAHVSDTVLGGSHASFRSRALSVDITRPRGSDSYAVRATAKGLDLDVSLDAADAPAALAAVMELEPGRVSVTEKRALLAVNGHVNAGGADHALDGGLAGYDYTHGLMPRRTRWNWAFLLGHDDTGEPIAINLVGSDAGALECGVFTRQGPSRVSLGRFAFDEANMVGPWSVSTGDDAVKLDFESGAAHFERRNLGLVRSRFAQIAGAFTGSIVTPSRTVHVARALGVVEEQDVVW